MPQRVGVTAPNDGARGRRGHGPEIAAVQAMDPSPLLPARRSVLAGLASLAAGCSHWVWQPLSPQRLKSGLQARVTLHTGELREGQVVVLREHTFTLVGQGGSWSISYDEVAELEVLERRLTDVGILGLSVVVILAIPLLVLLIMFVLLLVSSCPVVQVRGPDGKRRLLGEGYPGAVLGTLARVDLVPLPDLPDGDLWIDLENHAPETQYTDSLRLLVIDHPPAERVVGSHDGRLLRVAAFRPAARVQDLDGVDVTAAATGAGPWMTDLDAAAARRPRPHEEGLVADLGPAPDHPVLELELQSSPWLDHLALQGWWALGERLDELHRRGRDPAEAEHFLGQMRQAGIHLRVELHDGVEWRHVAWVPPVGWMVPRRVVVPLPVAPGTTLRVRLRGGTGFLVVHGVGVATALGEATPVAVPPYAASGPAGDELGRFLAPDGQLDVLERIGEAAHLAFVAPPRVEGATRTAFVEVSGWYEPHPRPEAQGPVLLAVRSPDRLSQVGLGIYEQLRERLREGIVLDPGAADHG